LIQPPEAKHLIDSRPTNLVKHQKAYRTPG
jgi:hypothetical protein